LKIPHPGDWKHFIRSKIIGPEDNIDVVMSVKVNALISGHVRNLLHIHIYAKITDVKTHSVRYVSFKIMLKTKKNHAQSSIQFVWEKN
jgi:hypothetical protein